MSGVHIYIYSEHDKTRRGNYSYGTAPGICGRRFETSPLDSFNVVEITHLETSQTVAFDQWISGTFQMRMTAESEGFCRDTIYITDGRFDVRYQAK